MNIYPADRRNKFKLLIYWIDKYFNVKMGVIAGLVTGSIVYWINIRYGYTLALFSFGKQFAFNLFMAGYNAKLCERLALGFKNKWLSITLATIIPSLIGFAIIYAIHFYGKTPDPFRTTYWQFIMNMPIFLVTALVFKGKLHNRNRLVHAVLSTKKWHRQEETH